MSKERETIRGNHRLSNGVVSASCAAVLAVYTAGYLRTQTAADRFAARIVERPPALAAPADPVAPEKPAHQTQPPRGSDLPQNEAETSEPVEPQTRPAKTPDASALIAHPEVRAVELPLTSSEPTEAKNLPAPAAVPEPAPLAPAVPPMPETASLRAATILIPSPTAPTSTPAPAPKVTSVWKDGTYRGWGYSRHGNIEAEVVIDGGRIVSASISPCRTRYSCSVISHLPPEVMQRQSPEVDYVSGATQSADAFYGAVVEALSKAK
jgi:uncharacterized protein with FMN-binding domain